MWKHILIQGLYQMFWLFFFMYAAPVLFEQYRITDNCTFIAMGPDENDAGGCDCVLSWLPATWSAPVYKHTNGTVCTCSCLWARLLTVVCR
jgi:hypothetical protein